jgi:hypothetical protein
MGSDNEYKDITFLGSEHHLFIKPEERIVFSLGEDEVIVLEKGYFYYRGERIDDINQVYERFVEWLNKARMM